MRMYREPLIAYVRCGGWLDGLKTEPGCDTVDSIVDGFMLAKIGEERVLRSWSIDRCRFRAWVRIAMQHYLLELARRVRQTAVNRRKHAERTAAAQDQTDDPAEAMDQVLRRTLTREAIVQAGADAANRGRADEWRAFLEHEIEHKPLEALDDLVPGTRGRKSAAMRRMRQLLVESVRSLVAWPGASDAQIDEEIEWLMGAPRRTPR